MGRWLGIVIMGTMMAQQSAPELATEGHRVFLQVLAGDQAKLGEAVKYMEQARAADPSNVDNLYNLARAYFYEGITFNRAGSMAKSEGVLTSILAIEPENTEALSFHGAILTAQSGGADIAMFMRGVEQMKAAIAKDPNNVNNRIVLPFTARNFPPQALVAMGNYDPVGDLEFVRDTLAGGSFFYAPHASVVMNAVVGEAYLVRGDRENARKNFEAALAQKQPALAGARAGRTVLDRAIKERMNGGNAPLTGGIFAGCHSCHLSKPEMMPQ